MVEEACGGESAAKSLKEQDEKGFRDSEVILLDFYTVACVSAYLCTGLGTGIVKLVLIGANQFEKQLNQKSKPQSAFRGSMMPMLHTQP